MIGKAWRALSPEKKKIFECKAKEDKDRYSSVSGTYFRDGVVKRFCAVTYYLVV